MGFALDEQPGPLSHAEAAALISDILLHGVRPRLEWCEQLAAYAKEQAERADLAEMKSERLEAELAAGREERRAVEADCDRVLGTVAAW